MRPKKNMKGKSREKLKDDKAAQGDKDKVAVDQNKEPNGLGELRFSR